MSRVLRPIRGGEFVVTGFADVQVGNSKYLFLLVGQTPMMDDMQKALETHLSGFGEMLQDKGALVRPYPSRAFDAWQQVIAKPWADEKLTEHMKSLSHPFLLIIDTDFAAFDPATHPWAIVWLEDLLPDDLSQLFRKLGQRVLFDQNIFKYIEAVARKSKWRDVFRIVKLKTPDFFGVAVDLDSLIEKRTKI